MARHTCTPGWARQCSRLPALAETVAAATNFSVARERQSDPDPTQSGDQRLDLSSRPQGIWYPALGPGLQSLPARGRPTRRLFCQVQLRADPPMRVGRRRAYQVTSRPNAEYDDVTDMFRRLVTLDDQSIEYRRQRDQIIARCLPLADHIARRFSNRGEPLDDLVQVARTGLIQAVNRFDAEIGTEFLAFAVPTMMGEVRRYFRDHGWSVKVPRRMKELGPQLNRAREELFQTIGRAPTASEIAGHLGIDREEVVQAQIASSAYSTVSFDATRNGTDEDEGRSISDRFGFVDANLDNVVDV